MNKTKIKIKTSKKSQITAFILIAAIILFIISAALYFSFSFKTQPFKAGAEKIAQSAQSQTVITNFVSPKIKQELSAEVSHNPDLNTVVIGDVTYPAEDPLEGTNIPYFEDFPELADFETKMSEHFKDYLIKNPVELGEEYSDCSIDTSNLKVNTKIEDKQIFVDVDNYIVSCQDTRFTLKFTTKIDSRIKTMYYAAKEVGELWKKEPESLDLTALADISKRDNLEIFVMPFDDDTVIYSIRDLLSEEPSFLSFAVRV